MPRRGRVKRAKRAPSFTPIVNAVLERTAEMLRRGDLLLVEMAASFADGLIAEGLAGRGLRRGDGQEVLGGMLVTGLARKATPEALALLHGLSVAAVADSVRQAADRELQKRSFARPDWAGQIGQPRFTEAWRLTEPYGDSDGFLLVFEYPGREPHALVVLVDWNTGGVLERAALSDKPEEALSKWQEDIRGGKAEPADAQQVADVLAHAVWLYDLTLGGDAEQNVHRYRGLVGARLRLLPPAREPGTAEVPMADRHALQEEFLGAAEGSPFREREFVVERLIDFASDYGDPSPLRWSPARVEIALRHWLPRKTIMEEEDLRATPDVLRAFVRFAGRRRGLSEDLIQETVRVVDELEAGFFEVMRDPAGFGPAKAMVLAMQGEAVDVEDEEAVQAWIEDFNARPREERKRLMRGPKG